MLLKRCWDKMNSVKTTYQRIGEESTRSSVLRVLNDDSVKPNSHFGTHPYQYMEIFSCVWLLKKLPQASLNLFGVGGEFQVSSH
jgi:hypothetical protein